MVVRQLFITSHITPRGGKGVISTLDQFTL
jgi:hypothetical protein